MADLATLRARLSEAENAYHQLMMGGNLVSIRGSDNREMSFNQASGPKLAAYIAQLNGQIATLQAGGVVTGRRGRSRAIFF